MSLSHKSKGSTVLLLSYEEDMCVAYTKRAMEVEKGSIVEDDYP